MVPPIVPNASSPRVQSVSEWRYPNSALTGYGTSDCGFTAPSASSPRVHSVSKIGIRIRFWRTTVPRIVIPPRQTPPPESTFGHRIRLPNFYTVFGYRIGINTSGGVATALRQGPSRNTITPLCIKQKRSYVPWYPLPLLDAFVRDGWEPPGTNIIAVCAAHDGDRPLSLPLSLPQTPSHYFSLRASLSLSFPRSLPLLSFAHAVSTTPPSA